MNNLQVDPVDLGCILGCKKTEYLKILGLEFTDNDCQFQNPGLVSSSFSFRMVMVNTHLKAEKVH